MRTLRNPDPVVEVCVGYAAAADGNGVAYARLTSRRARQVLRIGFRVGVAPPFTDRAVDYAALTAIARVVAKRGAREARFLLGNEEFVEEVSTGRGIADAHALPYVRLRCALNALAKFHVQAAPSDDLTQRARAEVALNVAA